MTSAQILESLRDNYPECLLADGFEEALIGVVDGACRQPVACYDFAKCVDILVAQGMDEEEAEEYLEFNTLGAYVGEMTPLFLHDWRNEELIETPRPGSLMTRTWHWLTSLLPRLRSHYAR